MTGLLSDADIGIGPAPTGSLMSDVDMGIGSASAPVTPGGLAKSFAVGVPIGAIGMGDSPALNPVMAIPGLNSVYQGINDKVSGAIQGLHQPANAAERMAQTVGEFTPGLIGGGEGDVPLATRALTRVLLPAAGSEAGGTLAQGTPYEGLARMGGAFLAGGLGSLKGEAPRAPPTAEELLASGGAKFDQARNLGVEIKPQSVQDFASRVKSDLDQGLGVDANLAPKTHGILDDVIAGPPAGNGAVATIDNLQSLRRKLGNAAGSIDKTERMAASSAKGALDDYLANLPSSDVIAGNPEAASALLKSANADYAAGSRSNAINAKVVRAELRAAAANSGQNVANTIRQRMADILINPSQKRGYSPQELAQMERIVRGTVTGNVARFSKNIFGGGGGLGTLATLAVGGAAGGLPGMTLAAPGLAGRLISDASTMRQVRILDELIRSRSPLAQGAAPALPPDRAAALRRMLLASAPAFGAIGGQQR